jgi:hypothetical protein
MDHSIPALNLTWLMSPNYRLFNGMQALARKDRVTH